MDNLKSRLEAIQDDLDIKDIAGWNKLCSDAAPF